MKMPFLSKALKSFLMFALVQLSAVFSAMLVFGVENLLFGISGYKWSGTYDFIFGLLAISESTLGLWIGLFYVPKRLGINIYQYKASENLFNIGYISLIQFLLLLGLFVGIGFSGIWKLILIIGGLLFS